MESEQRRRGQSAARWGLWSAYPARTRSAGRAGRWVPATATLAVVLLVWLAATRLADVPAAVLPDPVAVIARAVDWAADGVIARYLWPTVGAALAGAAIAVAAAVPLGIVMAHSRLLGAAVGPFVAFSQTVPLVAIAPLLVIWVGYGTLPIAILCAIIAFFPMVTTTLIGLRGLDMRMVENAWLDGASGWARLWHIELPVAAPAILAGIRAGFVLSMTGAIVGEFVMGGAGLGTLLTISREAADTVGVFAVLLWIAVVALALHGLIHLLERASARRIQGETT